MDSDDTFDWMILGILALMSASLWLHGRVQDMQLKMIGDLQDDVAFLKDVAREADAAKDDHV
jgi:hypothetical protein